MAITAGVKTFCGLDDGGLAHCWGGVLADGEDLYSVTSEPSNSFVSVETGPESVFGILSDGQLIQWGGTGEWSPEPEPDLRFASLDVGGAIGCGITTDGSLKCWSNPEGSWSTMGLDQVPGDVPAAVSAGVSHACILDPEGGPHCWGDNSAGQTSAPSLNFIDISCGENVTCGVESGEIACWGYQDTEDRYGILNVPEGEFKNVQVSWTNGCAERVDGTVACWGSDEFGQLSGASAAFSDWWP